jgi:hypothetical protein
MEFRSYLYSPKKRSFKEGVNFSTGNTDVASGVILNAAPTLKR